MRKKSNLKKKGIRLFIKRSVVIVAMATLIITCFFGIQKLLTPKQVVASEAQNIHYLSGGIEKQMQKQLLTSYNGQQLKVAYLTFDDGPSEHLPEILDILNEYNIKATFFMIGENLKKESYQDSVKRTVNEEHYVGVHSMTHNYHRLYREGYAVQEMLEAKELLYSITQTSPNLVRFPYGTYPGLNEELRNELEAAGLKTWDWTVDSLDWKYSDNSSKVLENVKSQVKRNQEVILFHEKEVTVEILPEVISYLKEQGYELRAYSEFSHFTLNQYNDERI